jgi:hypothetical protein
MSSVDDVSASANDSSVGVVTRLGDGRPKNSGSIPGRGTILISSPKDMRPNLARFLVVNGDSPLTVKLLGPEVEQSPLPSIEVNMNGAIPPLPHMTFMACTGIISFYSLYFYFVWFQF